jgi:chaperonin GroES
MKEDRIVAIKPLYDRVVVRRTEAETTTTGGIVLPGTASEKPNQGVVLAVGPGAELDNGDIRPLQVTVGDRVVFSKYSSSECTIDGEEVLILRESDILAIIEHAAGLEEAA